MTMVVFWIDASINKIANHPLSNWSVRRWKPFGGDERPPKQSSKSRYLLLPKHLNLEDWKGAVPDLKTRISRMSDHRDSLVVIIGQTKQSSIVKISAFRVLEGW